MIKAKVIEDSISELDGTRLTTFQLEYPRFIHAEVMTYRVFSRNASSSRAIPVKTQIKRVLEQPAVPVHWGANQSGMQARNQLTGWKLSCAMTLWMLARYPAVWFARLMMAIGLHKQTTNRILEPWQHIQVVVTATDWANFYAQRLDKDAQPEIQALARLMLEAHEASTPVLRKAGEWHLPYVTEEERYIWAGVMEGIMLPKLSAARCARVSYLLHDGKKASEYEDIGLFDRLVGGDIKHASPTEHQAMVGVGKMQSNFRGAWIQFRKTLDNENISVFKGFES